MSTYTNAAAVANYVEGWVTDDPFALERLIQRCEEDIDRVIVSMNVELAPTQVISVPGATGGTIKFQWNGTHPASVTEPYNVSATQLQTDLQLMADIGAGNVTVLGSNPWTLLWTSPWSSGFTNLFVPVLSVDTSATTPGGLAGNVVEVEARKLNPLTDLDRNDALALSNATCAQVEYRNAMGEKFFVRAQYDSVKGPDFTTQGRLPYLAPKAFRELAQTGLTFRQGRAVAGSRRLGVGRGWPNY